MPSTVVTQDAAAETAPPETAPTEVKPRHAQPLVLAAVAFAVLTPLIQNLAGMGLTQAEFAARGDSTLRVEGYAFSIWGLIYAGLIIHGVRQAVPGPDVAGLRRRLAWPAIAALVGIGVWIVVAAMGLQVASVVVIFFSLLVLLVPLMSFSARIRGLNLTAPDRWMTVWPLAALAGWLTVAAPLNLINAATALNALPPALPPTAWALTAVAAAAGLALIGVLSLRTLAYPLPVAWGLIGAFVAEQARNPVLGFTALGVALVLITVSAIVVFGFSRRKGRTLKGDTSATVAFDGVSSAGTADTGAESR